VGRMRSSGGHSAGLGHTGSFFLLVSHVDLESILDFVSCFFSSLSSINRVTHQQNSINKGVINRHRNYAEVCIGSALRIIYFCLLVLHNVVFYVTLYLILCDVL